MHKIQVRVTAKGKRIWGIAPGQRQRDQGSALLRLVPRAVICADAHRRCQRLQHCRLSLAALTGQDGNRCDEGRREGQGEPYDVCRELGVIVNTNMTEIDHGCGS